MQGLAHFEHDVVGDVNNVIDGAKTDRREAALHPGGAGADLYVSNDAGGVLGAEIGGIDSERDQTAAVAGGRVGEVRAKGDIFKWAGEKRR